MTFCQYFECVLVGFLFSRVQSFVYASCVCVYPGKCRCCRGPLCIRVCRSRWSRYLPGWCTRADTGSLHRSDRGQNLEPGNTELLTFDKIKQCFCLYEDRIGNNAAIDYNLGIWSQWFPAPFWLNLHVSINNSANRIFLPTCGVMAMNRAVFCQLIRVWLCSEMLFIWQKGKSYQVREQRKRPHNYDILIHPSSLWENYFKMFIFRFCFS